MDNISSYKYFGPSAGQEICCTPCREVGRLQSTYFPARGTTYTHKHHMFASPINITK